MSFFGKLATAVHETLNVDGLSSGNITLSVKRGLPLYMTEVSEGWVSSAALTCKLSLSFSLSKIFKASILHQAFWQFFILFYLLHVNGVYG